MDFDVIVKEWFYRLPKGYADAPYTEEELAVLDEVLNEQGVVLTEVDELDQSFLDAQPVKNTSKKDITEAPKAKGSRIPYSVRDREELEIKTKEDIAAILASPDSDISPQVLARIAKLLVRTGAGENIIRENVKKYLGRDASHAEEVLDVMLDGKTDEVKLASYLENRTVEYTEFLDKPTSWETAFKETGLSKQALGDLVEFKWSANPNLGIAEVALAILLSGGARPIKKGDLLVNGKPFEVGGIGKRLKGQSGFGGANDIRNGFIKTYSKLVRDIQQDRGSFSGITRTREDAIQIPTDTKSWGTAWMTTIQTIHKNLLSYLVDEDLERMREFFAEALAKSLTYLFQNETTENVYKWVLPLINDDGTINEDEFKREFMIQNLLYYINIETGDDKSNYFVLTDYDNLMIFETSREGIERVLKHIELYSMASFTPGAASGIATGIALKQ
jgi:hypothetical protein